MKCHIEFSAFMTGAKGKSKALALSLYI